MFCSVQFPPSEEKWEEFGIGAILILEDKQGCIDLFALVECFMTTWELGIAEGEERERSRGQETQTGRRETEEKGRGWEEREREQEGGDGGETEGGDRKWLSKY